MSKKKPVSHQLLIFVLIFSLIAAPFQSVASATELEELELENESISAETAEEEQEISNLEELDKEVEEVFSEEQVESSAQQEETVEENLESNIESEEENTDKEISSSDYSPYSVGFDEVTTTSDSITVSWTVSHEPTEDIELYLDGEHFTVPSNSTSYTFTDLIPNERYSITIETKYYNAEYDFYEYVSDHISASPSWSDEELIPVSIITVLNDELSYDEKIRIRGLDQSNKGFNSDEWIDASGELKLPLGKFEVTLYNHNDPSIAAVTTITIEEGKDYLNNPIQIQFRLKEMNEAAEPFEYEVSKVTETSFTLIWNSVSKITGFKLYAYSNDNEDYHQVDSGMFKNDKNEFTLNGLQANMTYWVDFYTEYVHDLNKEYYFKLKTSGEDAKAPKVNFENEKFHDAAAKQLGVFNRNVTEADMKSLEYISIERSELKTLEGLQYAPNLEYLYAYDNEFDDISLLKGLKNLTNLDLDYNKIEDISVLAELELLEYINLRENQISNVDPLKGLTNLVELSLSYNQIENISALKDLKQLVWLDLTRNQVSSLNALSELTQLRNLHLNHNEISDIEPLKELNQLESLHLRDNQITTVDALANLTGLKNLQLGNNQIKDISGLKNLNLLNDLVIYSNNITDISSLASLTNLEYLDLDDNQITDISALKSLTNLQYLYLSDNPITDISVLKELPNLQEVSLYGVEDIDQETVQFLRNRGVEVRYYNDDDDWNDWDPDDDFEDEELDPEVVEELKKTFPADKGFVVSDKGDITLDLTKQSNKEKMELTTEQTRMLIETKQSLVLDNGGVTTSIPASSFDNYDEPVTIEVKELERTPNSLSSTYDFTVKQGSRNISAFDEGVTLTFNVNAGLAKNPKNLKVFYFNEETKKWENIGGTYQNGRVTAVTYHFSIFTVMEAADEDGISDEIVDVDEQLPTPGEGSGTPGGGTGNTPGGGSGNTPGGGSGNTPGGGSGTPGGGTGNTPGGNAGSNGNTGTTPGGNTGTAPSEGQGSDDEKESDSDVEESTVAPVNTSADQKDQTNSLPNTATNSYQALLIGGLLLIAGLIVLAMKQRRRAY
ncbi:leucine-rich repeat domain-containing protein [Alkalihalobacillus trypoxylicola]|uniref:leucine-rich repeat domain-containing protein n=1 Tax=Alkalihalobacillus trypoxylicola TaxID=519424 RepID=UPI000AA60729|nr:leucine-rich repeat domain-containing protein [Alkalihalobacillus trypoxylicola]